ncbi:SprT-like family-domain-containing protein [Fimicolochytrium jonesii]|uniref:SprT-like family-domain-containing protein n=1 Tax=Fimicolochytrium jonesii TaxID=1396493 RepID=UPI0022FE5110|nr:SprT-like family-domain-containing protein [Fimicolochytrium jonesii]KAI8824269.1 SprT-like family-domain-containing protein [Fimicolochytrium jonesii]
MTSSDSDYLFALQLAEELARSDEEDRQSQLLWDENVAKNWQSNIIEGKLEPLRIDSVTDVHVRSTGKGKAPMQPHEIDEDEALAREIRNSIKGKAPIQPSEVDADELLAKELQPSLNGKAAVPLYELDADELLARELHNSLNSQEVILVSDEEDVTSRSVTKSGRATASSSKAPAAEANYKEYLQGEPLVSRPADQSHELTDPNPDLHGLFRAFNVAYFNCRLDAVEVRWSPKMTLCAGMCYFYPGGYCSVRLSQPLLSLRPRSDFINTLLHEMIHAYLFVTGGNTDHDGHGPAFLGLAKKINDTAGTNITVFHKFHDEVNHHRKHIWRCTGPCREKPPFFGYVRRSMNRKPQPADWWWADHQAKCGGTYVKEADANGPIDPTRVENEEGKKGAAGGASKRSSSTQEGKGKRRKKDDQRTLDAFLSKGVADEGKPEDI